MSTSAHFPPLIAKSISGKTQVVALIGADTQNSLSPFIHNFLASKLGHDMVYTTFDVAPSNLQTAIDGAYALGIKGLNITAPHKGNALKGTSAVNLLKYTPQGYKGYNTDIYGIEKALVHCGGNGLESAVILGDGGASKAAVIALENMGCKNITILSRKMGNLHTLKGLKGCLFIQATSATPDVLLQIAPPNVLEGFDAIFDMNYPKQNPWLQAMDNLAIFNGIAMLVFQAVKGYEILWDVKVPQPLIDHLLEVLCE
ncbi:MAG: hypothetical protein FWC69_01810 [Defluviitaleaceae bacterium]|nr:hypothetical protein [Defluviitaleaceae bacterium]